MLSDNAPENTTPPDSPERYRCVQILRAHAQACGITFWDKNRSPLDKACYQTAMFEIEKCIAEIQNG